MEGRHGSLAQIKRLETDCYDRCWRACCHVCALRCHRVDLFRDARGQSIIGGNARYSDRCGKHNGSCRGRNDSRRARSNNTAAIPNNCHTYYRALARTNGRTACHNYQDFYTHRYREDTYKNTHPIKNPAANHDFAHSGSNRDD